MRASNLLKKNFHGVDLKDCHVFKRLAPYVFRKDLREPDDMQM